MTNSLTLDSYQKSATVTNTMDNDWVYHAMGLFGESGELANKCKKLIRNQNDWTGAQILEHMAYMYEEAGDILWYLAVFCRTFGWDLSDIAQSNLDKLAQRQVDGTLKDRP